MPRTPHPKQPTPECRMTPAEAGKRLGCGANLIEDGLRQGKFSEWGCAIKREKTTGTTWRYIIYRERFELYMKGTDLGLPGRIAPN